LPKTLISVKLPEDTVAIIQKYMSDHACNQTDAIIDMINSFSLLKAKSETRKIADSMTTPSNEKSLPKSEWICLWGKPQHPDGRQQEMRCEVCRTRNFDRWKACQELKSEHAT